MGRHTPNVKDPKSFTHFLPSTITLMRDALTGERLALPKALPVLGKGGNRVVYEDSQKFLRSVSSHGAEDVAS